MEQFALAGASDDDIYTEAAAKLGHLYSTLGDQAGAKTDSSTYVPPISPTVSLTGGHDLPLPDDRAAKSTHGYIPNHSALDGSGDERNRNEAQIDSIISATDHNRQRRNDTNSNVSSHRRIEANTHNGERASAAHASHHNHPQLHQQPQLHNQWYTQQQYNDYTRFNSSPFTQGPYQQPYAYPLPPPNLGPPPLPHPHYLGYVAPQAFRRPPLILPTQVTPPYAYTYPQYTPPPQMQAQIHAQQHAYAQAHAKAQVRASNADGCDTSRSEPQLQKNETEIAGQGQRFPKRSEIHKTLGDFIPDHVLSDDEVQAGDKSHISEDGQVHSTSSCARRISSDTTTSADTSHVDIKRGVKGGKPFTIGSYKIGLPSRNTAEWKQHMTDGISTLLPDIVLPSESQYLPGVQVSGDLNFGMFNVVMEPDTNAESRRIAASDGDAVSETRAQEDAIKVSSIPSEKSAYVNSGQGVSNTAGRSGIGREDSHDRSRPRASQENRVVSIENSTDSDVFIADIVFTPPCCGVFVSTDTNALQWVAPSEALAESVGNSCLVLPPHSCYEFLVGCLPSKDVGIYQQHIIIALVVGDIKAAQPTIEYLGLKSTCEMQHAADVALLDADATPFFPSWMTTLFDTQARLVVGPTLTLPVPKCMTSKTTAMIAREMHRTVLSISAPPTDATPPHKPPTTPNTRAPATKERKVDIVDTLLCALVHEEEQHDIDIKGFDLYRHKVTSTTPADKQLIVTFKVPSLLERRPEVLFGHTVRIREETSMYKNELLATVFKVSRDVIQVLALKSQRKWFQRKQRLFLRFMVDHQPFKVMAFTLQCVRAKGLWLEEGDSSHRDTLHEKVNRSLSDHSVIAIERKAECVEGLNTEQREAAIGIADSSMGDVYLVHGPPGTGKTTAVISATLLAIASGHKVLLCAPSHAAADVLVQRLAARVPNPHQTLLRLYPYQRDYTNVPMDVMPYAHFDAEAACQEIAMI